MKKAILLFAILFALSACGGGTQAETQAPATQEDIISATSTPLPSHMGSTAK